IAVDQWGYVYVGDFYNHRVQKFTPAGAFLTKWGGYGSGDGQFAYPRGITVDGSGNVYVVDQYNHRIQKFGWAAMQNNPPTVTVPANITAEATGPSGAAVTFSATAWDAEDSALPATCTPASGSSFALGTTTVSCTATDSGGLSVTKTFSVTVQDTAPPAVAVPANKTVEATGPSGAVLTFAASATDIVDGARPMACTPASGSTFAVGTTVVTCSATDTRGNTGSASFSVTVRDTMAPALTVPASAVAEAAGSGGAVVTFAASGTDSVSGAVTASCSPPSGSLFPVGTTTVTCTATDGAGNTGSASFSVTVADTTPPVVTVPANIAAEASGATGAAVAFTSSASDIVDGPLATTCTPASGSTFAIGTTAVACSATDNRGNTGSASFSVTVVDTTPPAVTVPANFIAEATGPAGATVTFTSSASDIVDGPLAATCTHASGSTFAIGTTAVTCSATDTRGNTASASFSVTVADTTAPVVTVPANITAEASGPTGVAVAFTASATDLVDGAVSVSCIPASGSTFAIGTTAVTCSATDTRGNTASASFSVTVADTTAPVVTVPASITAEATGPAGAAVAFIASATDLVDGAVSVSCIPASGSTFAIGTTTVACSSTDTRGNTGSASFSVTVADTTPPVVTVPVNITAEATGPAGAAVAFIASATDLVDGALPVTCIPASGTTFPIGTTTANCSGSDSRGNISSGSFSVTVRDTTPPNAAIGSATDGGGKALAPGSQTLSTGVIFTFSGTDAVGVTGFECQMDDGGWTACSSAKSYSGLAIASHTFKVRALDAAGNADPTPDAFTWEVVTAQRAIGNLSALIQSLGITGGTATSLNAKLQSAQKAISDSNSKNDRAACGSLEAFLNSVDAYLKSGKLTPSQAAALRNATLEITAAIGC
ncbi:MAG: HYR domain-containing protein, partial [Chloroflexi bacterium]|nr:HYR domain-containing protein [Chloroflexota bacterium]